MAGPLRTTYVQILAFLARNLCALGVLGVLVVSFLKLHLQDTKNTKDTKQIGCGDAPPGESVSHHIYGVIANGSGNQIRDIAIAP